MRKKKLDLSKYNLDDIGNNTIAKRINDLFKLIILNKPEHKWNKQYLKIIFENGKENISEKIEKLNELILTD